MRIKHGSWVEERDLTLISLLPSFIFHLSLVLSHLLPFEPLPDSVPGSTNNMLIPSPTPYGVWVTLEILGSSYILKGLGFHLSFLTLQECSS